MSDTTLRMLLIGEDRSASSALNKVGSEAEKAHGKFAKLGEIAGGVFGGELLAGAAEKVGDFFKESISSAVDSQQKFAVLNNTMKNVGITGEDAGEKAEKFLTSLSNAAGITKENLLPAYTNLIRSTGNVRQAHHLLSTAMDVSAGTGQNLTAVSKALQKAHDGNVSGLSRLGIQTKDAQGKTLSFAAVQAELAQKFGGDWKSKAETAGGSYARLGVMFDNLKETVGNALLPVLTKVASWLADKVGPAMEQLGQKIGPVVAVIGQKLMPVVTAIGTYAKGYLTAALGSVKAAFGSIQSAVERNRPELEKLGKVLLPAIEAVAKRLGPVIGTLATVQIRVLGAAIGAAINVIGGMVDAFTATITAGKKVVSFFHDLPGKITGAFGDAKTMLTQIGKDIVQGLRDGLDSAKQWVIDKVKEIADLIPKWLRKKLGIASPSKVLRALGVNAIEGLALGITDGNTMVDKAMGKITDKVKNAASKLAADLAAKKGIASSFSGNATSMFGQTTEADGTTPLTASDVVAGGQQNAAAAQQYRDDIAALISKGASAATLSDIASQGASGAASVHALASGTAAQVAAVNASEAQQQQMYAAAGAAAANAVFDSKTSKDLGTFTLVIEHDEHVTHRKLLKLRRELGGLKLGFDT